MPEQWKPWAGCLYGCFGEDDRAKYCMCLKVTMNSNKELVVNSVAKNCQLTGDRKFVILTSTNKVNAVIRRSTYFLDQKREDGW